MPVEILMAPLVDVTALLGVERQQYLEMSGRWALITDAERVTGAVDLTDGVTSIPFGFTAATNAGEVNGYSLTPYRNSIPNILFDQKSQRWCGYVGNVVADNNPEGTASAWRVCNARGQLISTPKFSGLLYGEPLSDSKTQPVTNISANNGSFIGFVTNPSYTDPLSNQPVVLLGCGEGRADGAVAYLPQVSISVDNNPLVYPTYPKLAYSYTVFAGTPSGLGNQQACIVYNEGDGVGIGKETMVNITEIGEADNEEFPAQIRGVINFPGWGAPVVTDQNIDGPVFNNLGETNFTFQYGGAGQFANCLSVCGWDGPAGTAIDKTSGLPDHSQSSAPDRVPFDAEFGQGSYYTPLFPTEFSFNGTLYSFGTQNGIIRALTILNGNLCCLAEYTHGIGGTAGLLLMVGAVFELGVLKSDTLNWKMSLTYGMTGPGTVAPDDLSGLYPSEGSIGIEPEVVYAATPGAIIEDVLP